MVFITFGSWLLFIWEPYRRIKNGKKHFCSPDSQSCHLNFEKAAREVPAFLAKFDPCKNECFSMAKHKVGVKAKTYLHSSFLILELSFWSGFCNNCSKKSKSNSSSFRLGRHLWRLHYMTGWIDSSIFQAVLCLRADEVPPVTRGQLEGAYFARTNLSLLNNFVVENRKNGKMTGRYLRAVMTRSFGDFPFNSLVTLHRRPLLTQQTRGVF